MVNVYEELVEKLFTHPAHRLKNVNRYGIFNTIEKENTAEHSYYVGLYCLILAEKLSELMPDLEIDYRKLFTLSTFHDYDEVFTGDLPRGIKHTKDSRGLKIREALNSIVSDKVQETIGSQYFHEQFLAGKDYTVEGIILKIADLFCVMVYVLNELGYGNRHVVALYKECEGFFVELLDKFDPSTNHGFAYTKMNQEMNVQFKNICYKIVESMLKLYNDKALAAL